MKKKLLIILTLILFTPFVVNAYEVKMDWQTSFGGTDSDYFYSISITEDEEYIVVGKATSTDIEGITNKGVYDAIIVKYDKDGNMLWQKDYGGNKADVFSSVALTNDDGFVAVGYSQSSDIEGITNKGSWDAIIVKYDKDGNMLWQKNYEGNINDYYRAVILTKDEGFIAVGCSNSTNIEGITNKGSQDALIVKYDKDGNQLWQKSWGGQAGEDFNFITATEDNGFVVVGYSQSSDIEGITNKGGWDAIIVKYDKDGNMLWQKNYGGNSAEYFKSVMLTKDEGFIAVGYSQSSDIEGITNKGSQDAIIIKYDKDGNMLWQKNWGGNNSEQFFSVIVTKDDSFIASGYSGTTDVEGITNKGKDDAIIVKYDKNGNMLWQKDYGGNYAECFNLAVLTKDEDFIAVGGSKSTDIEGITNKGDNDAIMVKYSFEYDLEIKTTENGTSIAEQQGKYGIITTTPNEGYIVDKIIVKDTADNEIEVTKLEDGTYSFELDDDVTIEVLFKEKLENPKTGMSNIIGLMFTIALCFISGFFVLKNYNKNYEL